MADAEALDAGGNTYPRLAQIDARPAAEVDTLAETEAHALDPL